MCIRDRHGIAPGAVMFERTPELFEAIIWGMVLANLALIVLNLPLIGVWVRLLALPLGLLTPLIVVISVLGVYAQSRLAFDVGLLALFGLLGYLLRKADYPLAPIVFGAVLGPIFEDNLRRAFMHARGDGLVLLAQPLVLPALALAALLLLWPLLGRWQGSDR